MIPWLALPIALLLAEPAVEPAPAPATAADPVPSTARPLVLDVVGLDAAAVRDAMALRLRDRALIGPSEFGVDDEVDYAAIRRQNDDSFAVTLIIADGRAYDRSVTADPGQEARAVASMLVNLVYATERGEAPDRVDVPIPAPASEPEPAEVEPAPAPVPTPPPEPRPVPPPPPTPWELALAPSAGLVLGVAPTTDSGVLAAGHGTIAIDARSPAGALVGVGVRVGGWANDGVSLVRTRVELGGGYGWRWRHAELLLLGAATVELWRTRRDGAITDLEIDGDAVTHPVLLGGIARVSPGWLVHTRDGRGPRVRLGVRIDVGASAALGRGGHTIDLGVARPDGSRRGALRVGGLEIATALELAVWFALPTR